MAPIMLTGKILKANLNILTNCRLPELVPHIIVNGFQITLRQPKLLI